MAAKILLADWTDGAADSVARLLAGSGYVVESTRGDSVSPDAPPPQLIVLRAPCEPAAACRMLASRRWAKNIPLLVVTSDAPEAVVQALDAGAVDALPAGAPDSVFLSRVRNALRFSETSIELDSVRVQRDTAVADLCRTSEELAEAHAMARYGATHDRVTGLLNRDSFTDRLTEAIDHARRFEHWLAVLVIDLDRFRLVNDSLGHGRGNELLRSVAQRLLDVVRSTDVVARLASDEFAVALVHVRERLHAGIVATKLARSLSAPHRIAGESLVVNPSIGIALFSSDGEDAETLMQRADLAMSVAKRGKRGGFQFYEPRMNGVGTESLMIENGLRVAAERGELVLHYQPQLDSLSGEVIGAEALLRWQHPERGMMAPGTFLPVAESSGLIVPIGDWVVREAVRQRAVWNAQGIPRFPISVNVSLPQLESSDFATRVSLALREGEIDGSQIHFELTESCLTDDVEHVSSQLDKLRKLGIAIHIDDFGTGYSSLSKLGVFPLDTLKIDRSFVRDLDRGDRHRSIARAVITMATALGFDTIAEGVETHAELAALQELGCTQVQGFLFSPPLGPAEFVEWLNKLERDR